MDRTLENYDLLCQRIAFQLGYILNGEMTEAESTIARYLIQWGYLEYDKEEEYYRQVVKVK